MTDRYCTLTVVLSKEIRDDDAENLINAILQLKGVADVKGDVADPQDYMAITRAKHELHMKLICLLKND